MLNHPIRHLLLDAMGVIYRAGDDVGELLIPFVLEQQPTCNPADIEAAYLSASLGKLSADELWDRLGVDRNMEAPYLDRHRTNDGLYDFLEWADSRKLPVSCLSNDVGRWSKALREKHNLNLRVKHWIISGDVGSRKPSPDIYERFLRVCDAQPAETLFVDDRLKNVVAAIELGFRAVLFGPQAATVPQHIPHAEDFAALRVLAQTWADVPMTAL